VKVRLRRDDEHLDRPRLCDARDGQSVAAVFSGLDHNQVGMFRVWPASDEHAVTESQIAEHEVNDLQDRVAVAGTHVVDYRGRSGPSRRLG
jgi:hypothetical protein